MKHYQIARLFQALGDPVRLTVLVVLAEGERHIDELAALAGAPKGEVLAHLRLMRRQGWVESRRAGIYTYYRIADERVLALVALARELAIGTGPRGEPPEDFSSSM
ncbi:MAG: winged helix-turn-helix transcriptional regulator [Candidatus Omnitrophica bacterium]|nr:winged helix-turn-helix transcriptional regulator [Candidatus Omnitrophota bacterium]